MAYRRPLSSHRDNNVYILFAASRRPEFRCEKKGGKKNGRRVAFRGIRRYGATSAVVVPRIDSRVYTVTWRRREQRRPLARRSRSSVTSARVPDAAAARGQSSSSNRYRRRVPPLRRSSVLRGSEGTLHPLPPPAPSYTYTAPAPTLSSLLLCFVRAAVVITTPRIVSCWVFYFS